MPAWVAFGALTLVLLAVLLLLSIVSARAVDPQDRPERSLDAPERPTAIEGSHQSSRSVEDARLATTGDGQHEATAPDDPRLPRFESTRAFRSRAAVDGTHVTEDRARSMSTGALLANVAFTQGLFGVALLAGAAYFAIPFSSMGLGVPVMSAEVTLLGLVAGLLLWLGNELAAATADAAGVGYDEAVRSMLTPETLGGWVLMLGLILPTIAFVEELLFRGAAIGAMATGFAFPEPVLVVASSLVFGAAHGAQGRIGAAVATALGLLLGTAFVLTGSLLVVVVAHYLVNALEFVVHEGLDVDRPLAVVRTSLSA